jgi:T5SS/PEP-CTERM-associated repeat protein
LNSGGAEVNNLTIGDGSAGTLNVSGSNGLTVDQSLYVGETSGGTGTLSISSDRFGLGGTVNSGSAIIGDGAESNGVVTVTGASAQWNITSSRSDPGNLTVGNIGTGSLTVSGGGQVSASGMLVVGENANGTLAITSSGGRFAPNSTVSSANGVIGDKSGSTASSVTLMGSGSQWNISGGRHSDGSLEVGNGGTGSLTINAGTQVSDTTACIGCYDGTGSVIVNGNGNANSAEWSTSQSLSVGVNGTGSLTIENGGLVYVGTPAEGRPGHFGYEPATVGTITIGAKGTVILDGATVDSNVVNEYGGILDPLASTISGSYTGESGSSLIFYVSGPGSYDQIDLPGGATFAAGSIIDIVFENYTPTPGETFDFITGSGGITNNGVTIDINGVACTGCSEGLGTGGSLFVGVPEPGTWVLLVTALIAMAVFAVRKRRAALPDLAL